MAADTAAENWQLVIEVVGGVIGTIGFTFMTLYKKANTEGRSEDVVQKSVGAAFVDRSAASDLRSIAEDTRKIREIAEDEESRFKEQDLIEKALKKLEEAEARKKAGGDH